MDKELHKVLNYYYFKMLTDFQEYLIFTVAIITFIIDLEVKIHYHMIFYIQFLSASFNSYLPFRDKILIFSIIIINFQLFFNFTYFLRNFINYFK